MDRPLKRFEYTAFKYPLLCAHFLYAVGVVAQLGLQCLGHLLCPIGALM